MVGTPGNLCTMLSGKLGAGRMELLGAGRMGLLGAGRMGLLGAGRME